MSYTNKMDRTRPAGSMAGDVTVDGVALLLGALATVDEPLVFHPLVFDVVTSVPGTGPLYLADCVLSLGAQMVEGLPLRARGVAASGVEGVPLYDYGVDLGSTAGPRWCAACEEFLANEGERYVKPFGSFRAAWDAEADPAFWGLRARGAAS